MWSAICVTGKQQILQKNLRTSMAAMPNAGHSILQNCKYLFKTRRKFHGSVTYWAKSCGCTRLHVPLTSAGTASFLTQQMEPESQSWQKTAAQIVIQLQSTMYVIYITICRWHLDLTTGWCELSAGCFPPEISETAAWNLSEKWWSVTMDRSDFTFASPIPSTHLGIWACGSTWRRQTGKHGSSAPHQHITHRLPDHTWHRPPGSLWNN